jgi:hypothetical protein
MGIDNAAAKMLLLLRNEPKIDFSKAIILGRQHNYVGPLLRRAIQRNFGLERKSLPLSSEYADQLFEVLGMSNPTILDASSYEGATILHDLNFPIPQSIKNQFSTVIDIGTSEHIYNIPQALQNLKDLCKINGHLLMVSPANNWLGHGFYQFSPELFFRAFDKSSGFEIKKLFLIKLKLTGDVWYELNDPKSMGRRVTIATKRRCHLALIATKVSDDTNHIQAQQSDYESAWATTSISKLGTLYLKMPWFLRKLVEHTVISTKKRFKNRMSPIHLQWVGGRLVQKSD